MTRGAKTGEALGMQMTEPCVAALMVGKNRRPCIFEHGHKADGSTVFAFHKTPEGDTWTNGTLAFRRARGRRVTTDDLEAAGQTKMFGGDE